MKLSDRIHPASPSISPSAANPFRLCDFFFLSWFHLGNYIIRLGIELPLYCGKRGGG